MAGPDLSPEIVGEMAFRTNMCEQMGDITEIWMFWADLADEGN